MPIVKFDRGLYRNGSKTAAPAYGQIELNQVWFDRAGMVEAQCALDPEVFSSVKVDPLTHYGVYKPVIGKEDTDDDGEEGSKSKIVAENGMFLMVDKSNGIATIPNGPMNRRGYPMGINYSSEIIYDTSADQRRNFCLTTKDWLPRIGYLQPGMRFTTNTVCWKHDEEEEEPNSYEIYQEVKDELAKGREGKTIFAVVTSHSDGNLRLIGKQDLITIYGKHTIMGNLYCQVVKAYDNADRTCSFMFQVINKPAFLDNQEL